MSAVSHASEPYDSENLLDRLTPEANLEHDYRWLLERVATTFARRLPLREARVLSVRRRLASQPSPVAEARAVGLAPELHAINFTWRRLTPAVQRAVGNLDALGSRPRLAAFGHTLMLIARKP